MAIQFHLRCDGDYCELSFTMKMLTDILKSKDASLRRYKYHVESPATRGGEIYSLEFIAGPKTRGGVIDRSLSLTTSLNKIECGGIDA